MKLITNCKGCRFKFYINNSKAKSRSELLFQFGQPINLTCPHCQNISIHIPNEIFAEAENIKTLHGVGIGGVIGMLAGPLGVIIGLVAGGTTTRIREQNAVSHFNNTYL